MSQNAGTPVEPETAFGSVEDAKARLTQAGYVCSHNIATAV